MLAWGRSAFQKGSPRMEALTQAETQFADLETYLLEARPRMTGAETNVLKVHLEAVRSRLLDIREHFEGK